MSLANFAILITLILNLTAVAIALYKLGRAVEKFESIGNLQAREITQIKDTMKGFGEIITKLAVSGERQDQQAQRMNRLEQEIADLRRGEGFILSTDPLSKFRNPG